MRKIVMTTGLLAAMLAGSPALAQQSRGFSIAPDGTITEWGPAGGFSSGPQGYSNWGDSGGYSVTPGGGFSTWDGPVEPVLPPEDGALPTLIPVDPFADPSFP